MFLYAGFYIPMYFWLEHREFATYHVIDTKLDHLIPFSEYFIIPYLLWFGYMAVGFIIMFFTDKKEFIKMGFVLGFGMTTAIIINYFYPTMVILRPTVMPRDNFFTDLVIGLYKTDTSTNVFPSIHVFNAIAVFIGLYHNDKMRKHKAFMIGTFTLMILIILSTMFCKQHSVLDILGSVCLIAFIYPCVYIVPTLVKNKKPVIVWTRRPGGVLSSIIRNLLG
jgi:membrane-associated phospholipid phosphatase